MGEDETPREVDEQLDDLAEQGEEMEDRLSQAGSDAEEVDVPDPEDASGPGVQASDLVGDDEDGDDEDGDGD